MIVGVGLDVVDVARFEQSLQRTEGMAARLFTPAELETSAGHPRPINSLAARFAAKEALAKALGGGGGMLWTDAEVVSDEAGRPLLKVSGTVAQRAAALGADRLHLSLTHDGGVAAATVIAESS
jgi:holo-[acyl-carrier protein] synthase